MLPFSLQNLNRHEKQHSYHHGNPCMLGVAVQGLFGIVAGVFLSAILGIIYGAVKKNKQFLRWSAIALTIDIICIILFYFCLIQSDM